MLIVTAFDNQAGLDSVTVIDSVFASCHSHVEDLGAVLLNMAVGVSLEGTNTVASGPCAPLVSTVRAQRALAFSIRIPGSVSCRPLETFPDSTQETQNTVGGSRRSRPCY